MVDVHPTRAAGSGAPTGGGTDWVETFVASARARLKTAPLAERPVTSACSNAYARAISRGSLHRGPTNEMPSGSPDSWPAGTVTAG